MGRCHRYEAGTTSAHPERAWRKAVRPCELLITGADVVTESGTRPANVAVSQGVITSIGDEAPPASRTIDGEGLLLLPGGVDAHTHLNSVWPFVEERRPGDETLREATERVRSAAAADACIDYALHVVVSELKPSFFDEIEPLVGGGFPSWKFYTQLPD